MYPNRQQEDAHKREIDNRMNQYRYTTRLKITEFNRLVVAGYLNQQSWC